MSATRVCHSCGASLTLKGNPLTGNYCSPRCKDRSHQRQFGEGYDDRQARITRELDPYSEHMSSSYFDRMFDSHNENEGEE